MTEPFAIAIAQLRSALEFLASNTQTYEGGSFYRGKPASAEVVSRTAQSLGRPLGQYESLLAQADGLRFECMGASAIVRFFSAEELVGDPAKAAHEAATMHGEELPEPGFIIAAFDQSVVFLADDGRVTKRTEGDDDRQFDDLLTYLNEIIDEAHGRYEYEVEADTHARRKQALDKSGDALHSLIGAVAVSSSRLWTVSADKAFRWKVDGQSSTLLDTWPLPSDTKCASGSPDRRHVATGGKQGLALWNALGATTPRVTAAVSNGVKLVAWADENLLVAATNNRELVLWRVGETRPGYCSPQLPADVTCLAARGNQVYLGQQSGLSVFTIDNMETRVVDAGSPIVASTLR